MSAPPESIAHADFKPAAPGGPRRTAPSAGPWPAVPKNPARVRDASPATSAEARLVIACARTNLDAAAASRVDELLSGPLDWSVVVAHAARHRVRPLLYSTLSRTPAGCVPPDVMGYLSAFASANARRNLFLICETGRLLDLLQSNGIAAAPFKGPSLALAAYGNPGLREAGDLDFLLRRHDMPRANELLEAHGFSPLFPTASDRESACLRGMSGGEKSRYLTRHAEQHLLSRNANVNVDLHWSLALRDFWILPDPRTAWSWLSPQPLAGRTVLGFAAEETLLVLCINGAKDCWERLDRVCDVAELLRRAPHIDFPRLFALARGIGAARMLNLGLFLAAKLLDAPLSARVMSMIVSDRAVGALAAEAQQQMFEPATTDVEVSSPRRSMMHLRMRERLHDRLGLCLVRLEPTVGDWAWIRLPPWLGFLHFAIRPVRLLLKRWAH